MDPAGWRYVGKTGEVKGAGGAAGAIYDWFQDCKRNMPSWELYISLFDMGVSENRVPLNPMVDDHYPY